MKTFQEFYSKKDYPNALLTLEKNQESMDAGLWHYNMGTVLGEMNNWPMARYHFILAEKSGMHSKELIQNQDLVEQKLEISRLETPITTSDYLVKAGLVASEGPLTSLGLLFLVLGLWFLKKKPNYKSALILIAAVGTPLMLNLWINSWPKNIVTETKTLFEGPSALFSERGELPAGVMVLTNKKGEWEEIIYPARFSGWIKTNGLKRLELK